MTRLNSIATIFALSMAALLPSVHAQENILTFSDSWIRGSVPGQKNGAGYVAIKNPTNQPMTLKSVQSDRADRVELHTVIRENGMAKMREVQGVPIPANGMVELKPGSYHIMFIGLKQPFSPGDTVPMVLNIEGQGPVTVEFDVLAPTHQPKNDDHGHMKH